MSVYVSSKYGKRNNGRRQIAFENQEHAVSVRGRRRRGHATSRKTSDMNQ